MLGLPNQPKNLHVHTRDEDGREREGGREGGREGKKGRGMEGEGRGGGGRCVQKLLYTRDC